MACSIFSTVTFMYLVFTEFYRVFFPILFLFHRVWSSFTWRFWFLSNLSWLKSIQIELRSFFGLKRFSFQDFTGAEFYRVLPSFFCDAVLISTCLVLFYFKFSILDYQFCLDWSQSIPYTLIWCLIGNDFHYQPFWLGFTEFYRVLLQCFFLFEHTWLDLISSFFNFLIPLSLLKLIYWLDANQWDNSYFINYYQVNNQNWSFSFFKDLDDLISLDEPVFESNLQ